MSYDEWLNDCTSANIVVQRVRFEHNHVSVWVSVHARDGSDILQLMGL